MGQQLINQRTENEAAALLQNANAQLQQYQARINDLKQLAQQQQGTLRSNTVQATQEIVLPQTKIPELIQYIQMLTQQRPALNYE
jgi:hypothetical protein